MATNGTGELAGRVALVTGGVRRIGRAIGLDLARRGATIVVNTRTSRAEAEEAVREIEAVGGTARAMLADVTDEAAVAGMVEAITRDLGGVDILVNNAADRREAPFTEISLADWHAITRVVLDGAFLCSRAVIPGMVAKRRGTIVNIGGVTAHAGATRRAHVVTAKAGLVGLTKALAVEYRWCRHHRKLRGARPNRRPPLGDLGAGRRHSRRRSPAGGPRRHAGRGLRGGDAALRPWRRLHHRADDPRNRRHLSAVRAAGRRRSPGEVVRFS